MHPLAVSLKFVLALPFVQDSTTKTGPLAMSEGPNFKNMFSVSTKSNSLPTVHPLNSEKEYRNASTEIG